jgi:hypothetical protein
MVKCISKTQRWQQLKHEGSIFDPTILNFVMWEIKLTQQIDIIKNLNLKIT